MNNLAVKFNFLFLMLFVFKVSLGQIGINTSNPTSTLDINGDLRIRSIINSQDIHDVSLVVDQNGLVKKKVSETKGLVKCYLENDFIPGSVVGDIYKITGFKIVQNPNNDFDVATSTFKAPITGFYKITYTLTLKSSVSTANNVVVGLEREDTKKWINRFSILKSILPSTDGAAFTFVSTVLLEAEHNYSFGISSGVVILAAQSDSAGDVDLNNALGTFFEIQLVSN